MYRGWDTAALGSERQVRHGGDTGSGTGGTPGAAPVPARPPARRRCGSLPVGSARALRAGNRAPSGGSGSPPSCSGHSPAAMDAGAGARKERPKPREPAARLEKAKQRSAQQELKQRQRAEIYALNRVMTELEQQQFDSFCKQMQESGE
ncbi:small vasohibin-binding protein isoform X1 [Corvus kubaryi]|uniref:small vasohibin-binding protein isoform X1 n=2 Tax=Corvus kubaryi TaxID=68294 RepID=UPI001C03E7A3|nr:small vasohibin-binding protein isoform X1 [Corvus kubaryi]